MYKKLLLSLMIIFLCVCGVYAAGLQEQKTGTSGLTDAPATQDSKVVPSTAEQVYFSFSSITKKVLPVVVEIDTVEMVKQPGFNFFSPFDFFFGNGGERNGNHPPKERKFERPGLGSGIIISQDGNKVYVLTNSHVAGKAEKITVKLHDGREFEAKKIGDDSRMDLALISFECNEKVPVAVFGNSDSLEVGDIVLAVGTPYGFESSVTAGIVSGLGRKSSTVGHVSNYTDYIQTDASINPGNSGGALVNMKGEVVGINTWIATQSGGSVGLGFAIPSNSAKRIATDFMTKGKVEYGWLGVSIGNADENIYPEIRRDLGLGERTGALVLGTFMKSPAAKSGILPGDFIVKVNNEVISDSSHLTKVIAKIPPKEKASFTVIREGKEKVLSVVLETRGEETEIQSNKDIWPGIIAVNIDDNLKEKLQLEKGDGVVIVNVAHGTAAEKANFRTGDIIQEINDRPIKNMSDFYSAVNDPKTSKKMFQILREGQIIIIGIVNS